MRHRNVQCAVICGMLFVMPEFACAMKYFNALGDRFLPAQGFINMAHPPASAHDYILRLSSHIVDVPKTKMDIEQSLVAISHIMKVMMSGEMAFQNGSKKIYGLRKTAPTFQEWQDYVYIAGRASQYMNVAFMSKNQKLKDHVTRNIFVNALKPTRYTSPDTLFLDQKLAVLMLFTGGGAAVHPLGERCAKHQEFVQIGIDEAVRVGGLQQGDENFVHFMRRLEHIFQGLTAKDFERFRNYDAAHSFFDRALQGARSIDWRYLREP